MRLPLAAFALRSFLRQIPSEAGLFGPSAQTEIRASDPGVQFQRTMLGAMFQSRASARAASATARFSVAGSAGAAVRLRQPIGVCEGLRPGCSRAIALSNVRRASSTFTAEVAQAGADFFVKFDMVVFLCASLNSQHPGT